MSHFDVIIIGAGLSGIGAAVNLQKHCPQKSYVILERRNAIGGTWDLFRYPGIRSDSDMYTLGYKFRPWNQAGSIVGGATINRYINQTAEEHGIKPHIRFDTRVTSANWSTEKACWQLHTTDQHNNPGPIYSANLLLMCGGYYNYDRGYNPGIRGAEDFQGKLVHPQFWPEQLDYKGKNIVVVGSGATAMTLVPALAKSASKVTMVQRSPTYVVSMPDRDLLANLLRKVLPNPWVYAFTRFKNRLLQAFIYHRTRTRPEKVKARLLKMMSRHLDQDIIDQHFTPNFAPWDQRLCLIPNGDLYQALNSGKAEVITADIDHYSENGLVLKNGEEVGADIIVTATGLELTVVADIEFNVDQQRVNWPEKIAYKGIMYSDVPNMIQTFGYINASWTLRADMIAEYTCRLLNLMDRRGAKQVTPRLRQKDRNMPLSPLIDDFKPGYMQRVMHKFPSQGTGPWCNPQNYRRDRRMILGSPIDDGVLIFE